MARFLTPNNIFDRTSRHRPITSLLKRLSSRGSIIVAGILAFGLSGGCSLYYETKRPEYTDVSVVQKGTPRYDVTAALGKPTESYKKDGKDIDVFQLDPKGRKTFTKVAVNSFDTVADVFTIGMWEVVATPAEMLTRHKLTTYVVTYGPDQAVETIATADQLPKIAEPSGAPSPASSPSPSASNPSAAEDASPTVANSQASIAAVKAAAGATPAAAANPTQAGPNATPSPAH